MRKVKKVSFALCPCCFWTATLYKNVGKSCPQCNGRLTIQTVNLERTNKKHLVLLPEICS